MMKYANVLLYYSSMFQVPQVVEWGLNRQPRPGILRNGSQVVRTFCKNSRLGSIGLTQFPSYFRVNSIKGMSLFQYGNLLL